MKAKQKKNTVALVITIIELVAILGVYLSIGTAMGLSLAREQGWIKEKAPVQSSADKGGNKLLMKLADILPEGMIPEGLLPEDDSNDLYLSEDELSQWAGEYGDITEYDYTAQPEATPAPAETFYCPHCGAELWDEYASYCESCGLDPNAPAPTPVPELFAEQVGLSEMEDAVWSGGYGQIYADSTWESSIVDQKGTHNNSASALVDGNLETSWQEGVSGDGLGESVMLDFGRDVEVVAVEMYLGNHRTDEWFYKNNVPSQVTLQCYGAQDGAFEEVIVFKESHARGATCVVFNRPVSLRYLELFIDSVYKGSKYDDTCIAEIKVYGRYK